MSSRIVFFVLLTLLGFSAQAQVYKWVGPNGNINFTDTPPPDYATKVESKTFAIADAENNVALPFELAKAVKEMPVTLYTAPNCEACNISISFLKTSGIPFSEITVTTNEDIQQLKKINNETQVPLLFIGKSKVNGFNLSEWKQSLTQAGYPSSNMLPANYQFSPPHPAAAATAAAKVPEHKQSPELLNLTPRKPDGFQF